MRFLPTLRGLGPTLGRGLWGIGLFGLGDFSHTLIILAATQLLTPRHGPVEAAGLAGMLYVLHNVAYAVTPFPVGAASDRRGRGALLALGYALGAAVSIALGLLLMKGEATVVTLAWIFVAAGVVVGIQDTMESALVADLTPMEVRGTAYGVLGTMNGIGDLVSSLMVGALWTLHPMWGFGYAGLMMLAGAVAVVAKIRDRGPATS